jgi:hypothetical protein
MSIDIWSNHSKKKSTTNTLTIPTKKTTSNNTLAEAATANTTVQAKKVKAPKVKPNKTPKTQVQKHSHQQDTEPQLSDYNLSVGGDANGIYITVTYRNQPIYKFTLLKQDFDSWQRMDSNMRLRYIRVRVIGSAFNNDIRIIQPVIIAIYQILTNIFTEAQRMKAQQAQKRF